VALMTTLVCGLLVYASFTSATEGLFGKVLASISFAALTGLTWRQALRGDRPDPAVPEDDPTVGHPRITATCFLRSRATRQIGDLGRRYTEPMNILAIGITALTGVVVDDGDFWASDLLGPLGQREKIDAQKHQAWRASSLAVSSEGNRSARSTAMRCASS
jgi:hypothetical protein